MFLCGVSMGNLWGSYSEKKKNAKRIEELEKEVERLKASKE